MSPRSTPRPTIADWWLTAVTPSSARSSTSRIAHVALDELGALVEIVGPLAVRRFEQQVEDPHVVTLLEQGVDDVRADEAGAAGDEDHRRGRLASAPCPT